MPLWSYGTLRARWCLPVAMLMAMRAYGADPGAGAPAHSPLGDAVEQVCEPDSLNACDALIGFAVLTGLAQEERTRLAQQRLDAAATRLKRRETDAPVCEPLIPNSAEERSLVWAALRGSSVGVFRCIPPEESAAGWRPWPVDIAIARERVAQAVRFDQSLSKTNVFLKPKTLARLNALREKELQELEREKQEEANNKGYLPEKAISAVVELPSMVNEQAITFLESMGPDESRPRPERIRMALHLAILKGKKGDKTGAKAELAKALKLNCNVGLPLDMPAGAPADLADILETTREELCHSPDLRAIAIGTGSGAAICAGGVFTYLMLQSHQAEHDAYVRGDYQAYLARQSDAVLRAGIADGLYAVGAAGLIYLVFFNQSPPAGVSLVPGPSGVVVGGSF